MQSKKLKDGSYIDASSVWDEKTKKNQTDINQIYRITNDVVKQVRVEYGLTDSRYIYFHFVLDATKTTGLTKECDAATIIFNQTGIEFSVHNATKNQWLGIWKIAKTS